MEYVVEDIKFLSSNKVNNIKGKIYTPKTSKINGIVQVVHGMCEHFGRYIKFIEYMLDKGYIVCGHDQLGHGTSVNNSDDFGYFASKYGYKCLVKDAYKLTCIMKERYPDLRYIILGHSMGSFVTRNYMYAYGNAIDNVILSGTIGPEKLIDPAIAFADTMAKRKGERYRSNRTMKIAYKVLNMNIKYAKSKYAWVSRDVNISQEYNNDMFGNIVFTASGFKDLLLLVKYANYEMSISRMRKDLPILLISGDKDPIGKYGKGVTEVYEILKKYNCNAKLNLYKNGRHEMLNEINSSKVYNDIIAWLDETKK